MDDAEAFDSLFRQALSAMDAGDVATLGRLLTAHPRLARDRLTAPGSWLRDKVGGALDGFFKDPYLLWFVSEDAPVHGHLPKNIADVTRAIIRAGRPLKANCGRVAAASCGRSAGGGYRDSRLTPSIGRRSAALPPASGPGCSRATHRKPSPDPASPTAGSPLDAVGAFLR